MENSSDQLHILGFAGSLRKKSYNRALLQAAQELVPDNMTLEIFDLDDIPLFNADLEAEGMPAAVTKFHDRIAAADGLLIATPEYNWSFPGVLKNAFDWASRKRAGGEPSPLTEKPVAMMGAGGGYGTLRAQQHLRQILGHNHMYGLEHPQVHVATAWQKFDDDLRLTDEATRERVALLLEALAAWVIQLRP